ncbi:hypothetical protein ACTXT7_003964 [Hymenolepis weldensis]
MGNPRKNIQKSPLLTSTRRTSTDSSNALGKNSVEQIRHISFPHIPIQGAFSFHITKLVFSIIALSLQFLNIYRTVWWLGRPGVKYPIITLPSDTCLWERFKLDIDNIDFHLVYYILLMLVISPLYEAFQNYIFQLSMEKAKSIDLKECMKFITNRIKAAFQALRSTRSLLSVRRYMSLGPTRSKPSSLSYNIPRYNPFMPIRYATVLHPASSYTAMFYTLRMPSKQQQLVILRHNCARCSPAITENAAQIIRDEADILSADFNARLFDTIVGTAALTFYCTILPCFFVKESTSSISGKFMSAMFGADLLDALTEWSTELCRFEYKETGRGYFPEVENSTVAAVNTRSRMISEFDLNIDET